MKGIIKIILNENCAEPKYSLTTSLFCDDCYEVAIDTNVDYLYKDIINNQLKLNRDLKDNLEMYKLDCTFLNDLKINSKYLNNEFKLFENIECIYISGETDEIKKYITKNKELCNYNIILDNNFKLENKALEEIETKFSSIKNMSFMIDGNTVPVSLESYKYTVSKINEIVEKIKKYNYSPLEQIMYAYDLIRNRVYKKEEENEEKNISRDITNVLSGDKIVCVGYANIFDKVLSNLGIRDMMYRLNGYNGNDGHQRNLVYVKDDKYDVNGLYYFDLTWDCKKNNQDNSFINIYKYFAKTKNQFYNYDKENFIDNNISKSNKISNEFAEKFSEGDIYKITNEQDLINSINLISKLVDNKKLINIFEIMGSKTIDVPKLTKKIKKYEKMLNKEISANTFLKLLCNVRKNEYYENPELYSFSKDDLTLSIRKSGFVFEADEFEKKLSKIFGVDFNQHSYTILNKKTKDYIAENEIDKNINEIKLAKTLQLVYEKTKNA